MLKNLKTGYLEVLVLDELANESRTGYELISLLENKLGRRPSPGSMYPLLKKMLNKKLISVKTKGVNKEYSLTKAGDNFLKSKLKEKELMISKHLDLFKIILRNHICKSYPELDSVSRIKISKKISTKTAKLLLDLKEQILNVVMDQTYCLNEKKINVVLLNSISELKKINSLKDKNKIKKCKSVN